jgi:hypothetical protein
MNKPTFTAELDGADIIVLDDVLSQGYRERLYSGTMSCGFTKTESASERTDHIKHWAADHVHEGVVPSLYAECGLKSQELIDHYFPGETHQPRCVYTNSASYGDCLIPHADAPDGSKNITALWFVCHEWERDWGGELVFYDAQQEARLAVSPRPFRVCLFRGALTHCGTAPRRICFAQRFTLVWKYASETNPQEQP